MALVNCSECGTEVSDKASACPKCGNPIGVGEINVVNVGGISIAVYKNGSFCGNIRSKGDSLSISSDSDFELTFVETANGGQTSIAVTKGMNIGIGAKAKIIGGVKLLELS